MAKFCGEFRKSFLQFPFFRLNTRGLGRVFIIKWHFFVGQLLIDLASHVLISFVSWLPGTNIDFSKRLRIYERGFENLLSHGNKGGTKIGKTVITTATIDNVSGIPKRPSAGTVEGFVEMARKGMGAIGTKPAEFISKELALDIHVTTGTLMHRGN